MSDGTSTNSKILTDLGKCLFEAARFGNTEEVRTLMSNGAPLITDWLGTTPLHLAAIYGHGSTAEILIKSGISQDCRTKVDKVPLHFACQHGHFEIVKILIKGGAHLNAADMLNMTPLHWAVEADNLEICILLLKAGVKTLLKNKFSKTPLVIAQDKGYGQIEKLLAGEKLKEVEDSDIIPHNPYLEKISSVKVCRPDDIGNNNNNLWKKPKTRRFPMVAGTWTGGEAPNQERLEYSERKRLGSYKRKAYHRDDLMTPFLYGLHVSPNSETGKEENNILELLSPSPISVNSPLTEDGFTVIEGTPLEKLKETVRQSTRPGDQLGVVMSSSSVHVRNNIETSNAFSNVSVSYITTTPQPKNTLKIPKMTTSLENITPRPYVGGNIPMIPPYVISSLPHDMNTVPLNIQDLYKQDNRVPSSNMSVYCLPASVAAPHTPSPNNTIASLSQINDNILKVRPQTSYVKVDPQTTFVRVSPQTSLVKVDAQTSFVNASPQTSILKVSPQKREIIYTDNYPGSPKRLNTELLTKSRTTQTKSPPKASRLSQRTISLPTALTSSLTTKSKDPNPTIPVNIPVNMLNEVLRGVVTLHSLPVKQNCNDRTMETVAGITSDMGTVPFIPVSGEGGLQLIPLENASSQMKCKTKSMEKGGTMSVIKQETTSDSSGRTYIQHVVPAQHYLPAAPSPYYVQPQVLPYPYPVAQPSIPMLPPGYDIANTILGSQHSITKASENASVPVHPGSHPVIYVQQGNHPLYSMGAAHQPVLHQPTYPQILSAPTQQAYPRAQIHPTFLQQPAPPPGHVLVQATGQPTMMRQQVPHYVYVDANGSIISQVPASDISVSTKDS